EPVAPGTGGHSTMPQKRNPKLSQDIIAAAAQIRALVPLALDAMQTEHEADRTTSIMMSRALMQACELTGDMLQRMISLFEGLRVFPERMRENLDLSGGLIMAEALMLELGKQIGRQRAHDAVYDAAQASVNQTRPCRELPDRREHRLLVDELLDAVEHRLTTLPIELGALLAEEPVDVGVAAVHVGAASGHERLEPGRRAAERGAGAQHEVLERLLDLSLVVGRSLERPELHANARGLKIVGHGLGDAHVH